MWYEKYAAIIQFCAWTPAIIVYSIFKLRSLEGERERFAQMMGDLKSHRPEGAPDHLGLVSEPTDEASEGHSASSVGFHSLKLRSELLPRRLPDHVAFNSGPAGGPRNVSTIL